MRALDQPGNISYHVAIILHLHHAQVRNERSERVIGDLGLSRRHARDERGLARRRHAHERSIGHELHLKLDPALFGRNTQFSEGRSATRGRDEMRIAATARTAFCHYDLFAIVSEIG